MGTESNKGYEDNVSVVRSRGGGGGDRENLKKRHMGKLTHLDSNKYCGDNKENELKMLTRGPDLLHVRGGNNGRNFCISVAPIKE